MILRGIAREEDLAGHADREVPLVDIDVSFLPMAVHGVILPCDGLCREHGAILQITEESAPF